MEEFAQRWDDFPVVATAPLTGFDAPWGSEVVIVVEPDPASQPAGITSKMIMDATTRCGPTSAATSALPPRTSGDRGVDPSAAFTAVIPASRKDSPMSVDDTVCPRCAAADISTVTTSGARERLQCPLR